MLSFTSIMLNTDNLRQLISFYTEVFGKKPDWEDGDYAGFESGGLHFMLGLHSKVSGASKNPERVLINFTTQDVDAEFTRLTKLGAKVVAKPYSMGDDSKELIATLEDPDGNYFQLMSPMDNK